jgi:hypothetical protein
MGGATGSATAVAVLVVFSVLGRHLDPVARVGLVALALDGVLPAALVLVLAVVFAVVLAVFLVEFFLVFLLVFLAICAISCETGQTIRRRCCSRHTAV